jgi:hypothetical protein
MSLIATTVGKSVATNVAKKFGGAVVERWTRHRAESFFEAFVEGVGLELASGVQTGELNQQIDAMLADDTKSEILFDAYRRVCFST